MFLKVCSLKYAESECVPLILCFEIFEPFFHFRMVNQNDLNNVNHISDLAWATFKQC
jgi:hypothetical protein